MDFKDEFDFISEKAKQLTDTGIRKADEVIGISKLKLRCIKIDALIKAKYTPSLAELCTVWLKTTAQMPTE